MNDIDAASITREKRIWQVYKQSFRIRGSRFTQICTGLTLIILGWYASTSEVPVWVLAKTVRAWAEIGLSFAGTILGFLLAGFTIFATLTRTELFVDMLRVRHPDSQLTYLKHYFFVLMKVFVVFLAFAVFCIVIILGGAPGGVLSLVFHLMPANEELLKEIVAKTTVVLLGTWFVYAILLLKSFIFNIYQAVMMGLRYEVEKMQNRI